MDALQSCNSGHRDPRDGGAPTTRRHSRTGAEAVPGTAEYACAIERVAGRVQLPWIVADVVAALVLIGVVASLLAGWLG